MRDFLLKHADINTHNKILISWITTEYILDYHNKKTDCMIDLLNTRQQ